MKQISVLRSNHLLMYGKKVGAVS